jgi:hypothetical protein
MMISVMWEVWEHRLLLTSIITFFLLTIRPRTRRGERERERERERD